MISAIIPTRDRAALLGETLRALTSQDFDRRESEILVVDNGSTDGTRMVARSEIEQRTESSVRYIEEPEPGLLSGRHRGVRDAEGEILAFLDDDARVAPGWLRAIAETLSDFRTRIAGGPSLPYHEATPSRWLSDVWRTCAHGRYIVDGGREVRRV